MCWLPRAMRPAKCLMAHRKYQTSPPRDRRPLQPPREMSCHRVRSGLSHLGAPGSHHGRRARRAGGSSRDTEGCPALRDRTTPPPARVAIVQIATDATSRARRTAQIEERNWATGERREKGEQREKRGSEGQRGSKGKRGGEGKRERGGKGLEGGQCRCAACSAAHLHVAVHANMHMQRAHVVVRACWQCDGFVTRAYVAWDLPLVRLDAIGRTPLKLEAPAAPIECRPVGLRKRKRALLRPPHG